MSQSVSRKRPWLAALLGALATGFGHLYLRRWRRGLAWVSVLFGVTVLSVDPAAVEALASWDAVDPLAIAPILLVGGLSVFDAYLLTHAHNAVVQVTITSEGTLTHCPDCGKELDSDLEFCHWCTTEIGELEAAFPNDRDGRNDAKTRSLTGFTRLFAPFCSVFAWQRIGRVRIWMAGSASSLRENEF